MLKYEKNLIYRHLQFQLYGKTKKGFYLHWKTTSLQTRKCDLGNVDQALLERFKVQRNAGFPINGPILNVQAEKFAKQLGH
jgi:hypothetical protein